MTNPTIHDDLMHYCELVERLGLTVATCACGWVRGYSYYADAWQEADDHVTEHLPDPNGPQFDIDALGLADLNQELNEWYGEQEDSDG